MSRCIVREYKIDMQGLPAFRKSPPWMVSRSSFFLEICICSIRVVDVRVG